MEDAHGVSTRSLSTRAEYVNIPLMLTHATVLTKQLLPTHATVLTKPTVTYITAVFVIQDLLCAPVSANAAAMESHVALHILLWFEPRNNFWRQTDGPSLLRASFRIASKWMGKVYS
jgi:hypothetical protein